MSGPLVALLDGPLPDDHPALVGVGRFRHGPVSPAAGRHAAAMAAAILAGAPRARLLGLVVFAEGLSTSAACLAAALDAARERGAAVAHCSLGLARDDPAVRAAAARLSAAGAALVAAAPARGGPVWPAALPGVIAVQGDARCAPPDWSVLDLPGAAFGACPRSAADPAIAGASVAAAHFSGLLAARLGDGPLAAALAALRRDASFVGRERRIDGGA